MKTTAAAAAALLLLTGTAGAAPFPARLKILPLLSGPYVTTITQLCQPTLKVSNDANGVKQILVQGPHSSTGSGLLSFVQNTTPGAGKMSGSIFEAIGSSILLKNIGSNTTSSGAPFAGTTVKLKGAFRQSTNAVQMPDNQGAKGIPFAIVYGAADSGIAQSASLVGIDSKGCAETYTLIHQ